MILLTLLWLALTPDDFQTKAPRPPAQAYQYSIQRTGPFEVAKIFGRSVGCQQADVDLIQDTTKAALDVGLDPRIIASIVAVESGCNQFAVSGRGAIGLMQIMVPIWKDKYDFTGPINLLNQRDNLKVGSEILANLVMMYGLEEGIHRYNGLGVNCPSCDTGYASKILSLSGRK